MSHVLSYGTANAQTFQSPYCQHEIWDNEPVLAYLERHRITAIWGDGMLIDPLVFKANGSLIGADPLPLLHPTTASNRFPAMAQAVIASPAPSFLFLVPHMDKTPTLVQILQAQHIPYQMARFFAQSGYDVVVITPGKVISPLTTWGSGNLFQCLSS